MRVVPIWWLLVCHCRPQFYSAEECLALTLIALRVSIDQKLAMYVDKISLFLCCSRNHLFSYWWPSCRLIEKATAPCMSTATTLLQHFMAVWLGLPGWASTRRNIHPLTYPDHQPSFISFFHLFSLQAPYMSWSPTHLLPSFWWHWSLGWRYFIYHNSYQPFLPIAPFCGMWECYSHLLRLSDSRHAL